MPPQAAPRRVATEARKVQDSMAGKGNLEAVKQIAARRAEIDTAWRHAIIEAFLNGHSMIEISEVAGVNRESVRQIIRKAGF